MRNILDRDDRLLWINNLVVRIGRNINRHVVLRDNLLRGYVHGDRTKGDLRHQLKEWYKDNEARTTHASDFTEKEKTPRSYSFTIRSDIKTKTTTTKMTILTGLSKGMLWSLVTRKK